MDSMDDDADGWDTSDEGFGPEAKDLLGRLHSSCWLCDSKDHEFVHVVSKEDNSLERMAELALLNFDVDSPVDNGIALCPDCHLACSDTTTPGFIFFPSDLEYFIEFERHDQRRRREGTAASPRRCPTAAEYAEFQAMTGGIASVTSGGLYDRYVLYPHTKSMTATFGRVKTWHGAPPAALKGAWLALGALYRDKIPPAVRGQLNELLDLYLTDVQPQGSKQNGLRRNSDYTVLQKSAPNGSLPNGRQEKRRIGSVSGKEDWQRTVMRRGD